MTWTYISTLNDGDDEWMLVEDGVSKATVFGKKLIVDEIAEAMNLLDASRDKGAIQAFADQHFDIVFTPQPPRPKSRRKK